ncbi:MAG: glycosyltransferase [Bacteroidales bacterium]|jgi:glycosyltransferase involved in cell wall biosynthesis|nr:glycosyltransferase [Bacteroidales bacterium]
MPLVSVAIITYNHEKYISETIESILMQRTNFQLEIVIGEDCSTDNTSKICLEYQKKYPDTIKLLSCNENRGFRQNTFNTFSNCKGEYIAFLEGDDFWTDENKLQKQVDVLNDIAYQKYNLIAACCQTTVFFQNNISKNRNFSVFKDIHIIDFEENIEKWQFATCSFIFKNFFIDNSLSKLKDNFCKNKLFWSDRPLEVLLSMYGNFIYLPENMCCFRRHGNNMTIIGNSARHNEEGAFAYLHIAKLYPDKKEKIKELVLRWLLLAAEDHLKNKHFKHFFRCNFLAFMNISSFLALKNYVKCNLFFLVNKKIYK